MSKKLWADSRVWQILYTANVHQQIYCVCQVLEVVQSFLCQYNVPLLSYIYSDAAFFIGW